MANETDLEHSDFQDLPAYRYIRASDKIPRRPKGRDPVALVKIFDPTGSWTWYIVAYDPKTRIAFGLVDGFEAEVGDFSMQELVDVRGAMGLPLERDIFWTPRKISEIATG